jgi:ATP-dependent DNA helicase RecG
MSRFLDLLDVLSAVGEHSRIEAKHGSVAAGDAVIGSIVGFSNEPGLNGGDILFGLSEDQSRGYTTYEIAGVGDADRLQQEIATRCANDFNVPVRPDLWVEVIDGKTVVGAHISEAPPSVKPVYVRAAGLPNGAFRRIGSTDQRCSEDDLLVLYDARQSQTYDEMPVQGASLEDIDPDLIDEYRKARARVSATAEELSWSDRDLLYALGCAAKVADLDAPTVAGILLFGKSTAIRRHFPMMRVDYIRVPGKEWVADPETRFESIDMRGPLIRLVPRAHAAVLDDLPAAFSLPAGGVQRQDLTLLPDRVVREAIVNAVMHRSYRIHGPIQIIRYSNRLEIRNPGHSLIADDRLGEPGSQTRNPRIAAVFHEIGYAETKGSGIRVMRQMMEAASLSPPTFESDREKDQFVATLLFHHFLSPEDLSWLAGLGLANLSDEDAKALIYVREAGGIWNGAYRFLTGVDTLTASTRLRRLRDQGLLAQRGHGAATYYVPTDALGTPSSDDSQVGQQARFEIVDSQGSSNVKSQGFDVESQGFNGESQGFDEESQGLLTDSSKARSRHLLELPVDLFPQVLALGRHSSLTTMRSLISALCAWRDLSPAELADVLGRGRAYLVRTYLGPMVRDGLLERTIPHEPAHPQQRYRTSQERGEGPRSESTG